MGRAFKVARMDFSWADTEKAKKNYSFASYDGLTMALTAAGVRPYFILGYWNPLYDSGNPCTTQV